ncbi:MAG TPA: hypothetical protein VND65_15000 [Candidatus Binatia bacterium]|nr:hypothetical protein [Candidatus Binatia bacterium]
MDTKTQTVFAAFRTAAGLLEDHHTTTILRKSLKITGGNHDFPQHNADEFVYFRPAAFPFTIELAGTIAARYCFLVRGEFIYSFFEKQNGHY